MSYIQIEIGGKLRGLKFNQYAMITFYKHVDLKDYDASSVYAMIYAGLKANAYVKREEFVDKDKEISFEQVCDWCDSLSEETVISVLNVFMETESYKKLIKAGEKVSDEELTKKKLMSTELKT